MTIHLCTHIIRTQYFPSRAHAARPYVWVQSTCSRFETRPDLMRDVQWPAGQLTRQIWHMIALYSHLPSRPPISHAISGVFYILWTGTKHNKFTLIFSLFPSNISCFDSYVECWMLHFHVYFVLNVPNRPYIFIPFLRNNMCETIFKAIRMIHRLWNKSHTELFKIFPNCQWNQWFMIAFWPNLLIDRVWSIVYCIERIQCGTCRLEMHMAQDVIIILDMTRSRRHVNLNAFPIKFGKISSVFRIT